MDVNFNFLPFVSPIKNRCSISKLHGKHQVWINIQNPSVGRTFTFQKVEIPCEPRARSICCAQQMPRKAIEMFFSPAKVEDWGLLRFFPILFLNCPIFLEQTDLVSRGLCWCSFLLQSHADAYYNCSRCLSFSAYCKIAVSQKFHTHKQKKQSFLMSSRSSRTQ